MVEAVFCGIRIWFIMTTVLSELLKKGARVFDRANGWFHTAWWWWWWKGDIVERPERGHSYTASSRFGVLLSSKRPGKHSECLRQDPCLVCELDRRAWSVRVAGRNKRRASLSGLMQIVHRSNGARMGRRCCLFRKHMTRQSNFACCRRSSRGKTPAPTPSRSSQFGFRRKPPQ